MGQHWSIEEEQLLPADRYFPLTPHLKPFALLYSVFYRSQNAFQQEMQASSTHPHCTEVSQSDLSMNLLAAQLEREHMLGLLSLSQVGNGGNTTSPWLQRVCM